MISGVVLSIYSCFNEASVCVRRIFYCARPYNFLKGILALNFLDQPSIPFKVVKTRVDFSFFLKILNMGREEFNYKRPVVL